MPGRILFEEEEEHLALIAHNFDHSQKPSLSIGKVLSQSDMNAVSVKLSKSGKTAFVATNFPSALKIIDISDSEYPVILSSLALSKENTQFLFKSLLVSSDETKIYISNFENLEIVDISDLKSPLSLGKIQDKTVSKSNNYETFIYEPNLLISKDSQFLFVSGLGLQVFDVSVPTTPTLISSVLGRKHLGKLIPSSITLSQDRKGLYYTDGTLWLYNMEDPRNLKVISSFNTTTYQISSMILSKDFKSAFVLGLDSKESKILVQKLDIQDFSAIKEGQIIQLNTSSSSNPVFVSSTPNDFFLLIRFYKSQAGKWHNFLVFDTQTEKVLSQEKMPLKDDTISVLFTEDYRKVLVGSDDKLKIVELYLDYPNKNAFTNSSNLVKTLNLNMEFSATTLGSSFDESIFYNLYGDTYSKTFGIYRMSKKFEKFTNISSYETGKQVSDIFISRDNKRAYLIGGKQILVLDISNPEEIKLWGKCEQEESEVSHGGFVLSGDGKIGFMTYTYLGRNLLSIIDFSDPMTPMKKSTIDVGNNDGVYKIILSKDERTVFVISRILSVYDISDHSSPAFLTKLSFLVEEAFLIGVPSAILSPDGKTLVFKDPSSMTQSIVHIIDVTNVASPQIMSEFRFTAELYASSYVSNIFAVSPDSTTLFVFRDTHLVVVDMSNRSSPRYLGAIRIVNSSDDHFSYFKLSHDAKKAYFFTTANKFHVVSIQPKYSTYLKQDTLMLGERYSIDLEVLAMDKEMNYNAIAGDYRFTKCALVESRSLQNANFEDIVLKPTPSWMSFDLKGQALTVEARRKSDIGVYRVYFGFSKKVPKDAFSKINETGSSENIIATLLGLGYIDNQLFLTENFEELEDFILPDQYPSWVKERIYRILKTYSFGTFNELNVVGSLGMREVGDNKRLQISTASVSNLKVEINLLEGGKFLTRYYGSLLPTITHGKSQLVMEGSLKDINLALGQIVVNLQENLTSCNGEIIIDDKLNPVMIESVGNISRYFYQNMPPGLNENLSLTIQSQVDKELVWTGQYFQIKLNPKTFFDHYTEVENLNYQLVFVKDNNETTFLPTWLSFSDMTLMGTAPEEIFNRDFDFKLVVKNEFQEYKEPLRLHVKISSNFVLKLLMKYSPYILSVVGLLISANKIFNIVFKSTYKHPKDFHVRIGEEITSEVIFPISFIQEEMQEAKKILQFLEKKFGNKEKLLLTVFSQGERKLSRSRISETINSILSELSSREQESLDFYFEGQNQKTQLVDQIVFNALVTEMMKSNEESETRIYYEKVKKHWTNFVDWDSTNSCFKINDEKFQKNYDEKEATISTSLMNKSKINFDLLKDAILVYAFEFQNLDVYPESVQFKVKIRRKANYLKRFLKSDLQDCPFSEKGKIGYGIRYHREFNSLFFSGTAR